MEKIKTKAEETNATERHGDRNYTHPRPLGGSSYSRLSPQKLFPSHSVTSSTDVNPHLTNTDSSRLAKLVLDFFVDVGMAI